MVRFNRKRKKPALMGRLADELRSQQPFRQPLCPMEADRWLCAARLPGLRLFDGVHGLFLSIDFCVKYHAGGTLSTIFVNKKYSFHAL
jgi:hypothetical protein